MKQDDFWPVIGLLEEVGAQIADWRTDADSRVLHNAKEFKTEADQRAHDIIVRELQKIYPGVAIVSEESVNIECARPDAYWLIDPIDGTASWYNGYSGFVTQAAYIERDKVLFGVIHAPVLDKTWDALQGHGARLNSQKLPKLKVNKNLRLIDNTSKPHGLVRDLIKLFPEAKYLESGSLGLKAVLVADGSADLFVKDVIVRDWDLAPAAAILTEVGAILSKLDGSPYVFDGSYEKKDGIMVARDYETQRKALDGMQVLGRTR